MQLYVVLVMALAAGARAGEGGGFFQTIRNGFNAVTATVSAPFTTPKMVPYTVDRTVMADDQKTVLYEERTYPAQKWVCSRTTVATSDSGNNGTFWKLFGYIGGANEEGQNVPMTSPVSMMRVPVTAADPAEAGAEQPNKSQLTMCFYINQEFQENPPTPTNSEVFLEDRPTLTVLASKVGGRMSESDWQELANKLKQDATAQGESGVDYSKFYRAGYNSPMQMTNRRNEVWYVKQA